ncbi:chitinase 2-like [Micractinium conductrix]|uniref:Chitinase 2-like n=1 Tax=Micractinium conductrix TaxID=554055 RepID=A0A2P6V2A8_9CHLO|nr:chitinase 2-like [Micractinium conductrix]|eukprot:PSC68226.1 chitinase 2-like [Micractinium conductrix]
MFIAAYAGARPLGRPLPALAAAPGGGAAGDGDASLPLHLIYSFARDAAHDGVFTFYDPAQLERAASQQHPTGQRGMLSLAGAGFAWGPAVPLQQWVENAAASLEDLMTRYSLVGLDVNYEEGLDAGGFPEALAALVAQLKAWRPSLLVTVVPFDCVWPHYRQLLQLAGSNIDYVNWQVYAELESPHANADQIVAAYERLARELGGSYGRLTLGVNTEPEQLRGPQLAACLDAFRRLKARGIGGAFTWALDNSAVNGCCALM